MPDPRKQQYDANKLAKRLQRQVGKTIGDFNLIEESDLVMVCVSGGKDSLTLLELLQRLQSRAPVRFELVAVNLDQGHPGFPEHVLPELFTDWQVPYRIIKEDTYRIVKRVIPEGRTMCGLCSRLRRGVLYRVADEIGASRIALGHHLDDIVETLFLNMFHGGKLKAMPPKLQSDDGRHSVIRPLAGCRERDIAAYAQLRGFPIIPCDLCGSQEGLQRQQIKAMLAAWQRQHPGRFESIAASIANVAPSHLADRSLFDFNALGAGGASAETRAWLLPEQETSPGADNTSTETSAAG